jgi:hypothetical protein
LLLDKVHFRGANDPPSGILAAQNLTTTVGCTSAIDLKSGYNPTNALPKDEFRCGQLACQFLFN